MKVCFNDMLYAFSFGLDCVEGELLGVSSHHSRRVGFLCVAMGKEWGFSEKELLDLAAYAVLHDNALTEYLQEEYENGEDDLKQKILLNVGRHCVLGEQNVEHFPFYKGVRGAVLYHHENADGSGPFRKMESETPLYAQMIHLVDQVDAKWELGTMTDEKRQGVKTYVSENRGRLFSKSCADVFLKIVDGIDWKKLCEDMVTDSLRETLPFICKEYQIQELHGFCDVFAKIVDYKSHFTQRHSIGMAEKCVLMGSYYGFGEEKIGKLYFAGALHDIGKLAVSTDILEKPDRLTEEEYHHIQNHAYYTYYILNQIKGLEDVTIWASSHHEKLNGTGYPFKKNAKELGFEERLLACLDIYQALTEERPYKKGFSHEKTMGILQKLVDENALDGKIVSDIEKFFDGRSE